MASPDPELKPSTFGLPQWIKLKPSDSKDFESPFAASPPPHEDPFLHIRYPKASTFYSKPKQEKISNVVVHENIQAKGPNDYHDWSKHTKPCRDVLHGIDPITTAANPIAVKTTNTQVAQENLKSEACGPSVVKVAHKMVSSNRAISNRGFTVATPSNDEEQTSIGFKPDIDMGQYQLSKRRGSRSLPASPNVSPTARRKNVGNRYFTSPFEPSEDTSNRSWLTKALLGFRKDLSASNCTLHEEEGEKRIGGSALLDSVESLGPSPKSTKAKVDTQNVERNNAQEAPVNKPKPAFRPIPSEFREMNFWSPTSM